MLMILKKIKTVNLQQVMIKKVENSIFPMVTGKNINKDIYVVPNKKFKKLIRVFFFIY